MKKYTFSLILSVVSIVGNAQKSNPSMNRGLWKTGKAMIINSEYLDKVQDVGTTGSTMELHHLVSTWDITKAKNFDKRDSLFEIVFKSNKGSIKAHYNSRGEIEAAYENFKNIALPQPLIVSILKGYPGATIEQTKYTIKYRKDYGFRRQYHVLLSKNGDREWVKLDAS